MTTGILVFDFELFIGAGLGTTHKKEPTVFQTVSPLSK